MVQYKCSKCNKIFGQKGHYDYHINRKRPCNGNDITNNDSQEKTIKSQDKSTKNQEKTKISQDKSSDCKEETKISEINEIKNKKQCQYCKKTFTRVATLNKHIKEICRVKKEHDLDKENLMTRLIEEREEHKKQMQEMIKKMEEMKNDQNELLNKMSKEITELKKNSVKGNRQKANSIQNAEKIQNNTINSGNTVNNIKIIAYGKEDLSHLLEGDYKQILNKGFKSVPALVESIHFNKNKPENHNIYISNMRDNYVLIYDGKDWQLRERENVLQEMVDNKTDILNEKFEELVEQLDELTVRKFRRFLDQKDDDAVANSIKRDL